MSDRYIELHARSAFSFHRGASQPETLIRRAAELDMDALALCDRDGVYGAVRLDHAGRESGVRALIGSELTLEDGSVLPVLVRSKRGYQNLCQLITTAKLRSEKNQSRILWSELHEGSVEGLVCLTGDEEGPVRRALASGNLSHAEVITKRLIQCFGSQNVYLEIQRHYLRSQHAEERLLLQLGEQLNLPLLATNGVAHATVEGRCLLDAFTCLRHHTHLDQAGHLLSPNAERYLKNAKVMKTLFSDIPEAIHHTSALADSLEFVLADLGYRFPEYPVEEGETMASVLRRETFRGAQQRYKKVTPQVKRQLEHELELISRLGFCGYFLIVWDLVRFARTEDILVQGRGSAANSAVCYCLGITNADPIAHNLLFERFLSEGRRSWPDIDLDLPSGDRRENVIQEVYRRFAPRGAAMTANVITYRGRSAMREMGKVLNFPEDILSRFSKLFSHGDLPEADELEDQLNQAGLSSNHPRFKSLIHLYQSVYRLPRHLGQHSGGMVICDRNLDQFVPLENASMPGRVVLQWDKDDCQDLGIIKVDLLGLGMMASIQDALHVCAQRGEERKVDLAHLPMDDEATFAMMQNADTIGVFQIESRAQMATLPRMLPRCFYDVVIQVALIRPGPIVGNLVHPYLNRRNGKEPIHYIHEQFKPILERTLGVPLFQEQVLKMAMVIANFTGSKAEELRRAISFHRSDERMSKVTQKLREAMSQNGIEAGIQDEIVQAIQSFALYGFPESHAISFALLAYASAWLKAHRTPEFFAALLNNQPMGFYSPSTLIRDARRHGLKIYPVNVITSEEVTTVLSDTAIRLGLNQVRGLHRTTLKRITVERKRAPWIDLNDFLLRAQLSPEESRLLAKIGALNGLSSHRRDALWQIENRNEVSELFSWGNRQQSVKESPPSTIPLARMNFTERLSEDYKGLGLTTDQHPMIALRHQLSDTWRASDLKQGKHGDKINVAGMVICRQRPSTAKGHLFISLEDETGIANIFVHVDLFEASRLVVTQEPFLKIYGQLQNHDQVISVYAINITALPFEVMIHKGQSYDFH